MNEINQERFEAWLFAQPKDRVIEAGSTTDCFLCSFLKETTSVIPNLSWSSWKDSRDWTKSYPIPKWARRLVAPGWCNSVALSGEDNPITVAQMQARYIELFGPVDTSPLQVGALSANSSPCRPVTR